jgi:hypothetical protein
MSLALPRAVKSDETRQEESLMPDEDVQDEMRNIMAKFKKTIAAYKETTEQTLITVL